jgi:hypothetical protein
VSDEIVEDSGKDVVMCEIFGDFNDVLAAFLGVGVFYAT